MKNLTAKFKIEDSGPGTTWLTGEIIGTVFTGDPTRTTWGNTIR